MGRSITGIKFLHHSHTLWGGLALRLRPAAENALVKVSMTLSYQAYNPMAELLSPEIWIDAVKQHDL